MTEEEITLLDIAMGKASIYAHPVDAERYRREAAGDPPVREVAPRGQDIVRRAQRKDKKAPGEKSA